MDSSGGVREPDRFFRELEVQFLVHELKDPLATIEAGVRSLLEKEGKFGSLSPRQERTLKRVLRGALKGRSLLNHLLEIGRSEAGQIVRGTFRPAKTVYAVLLETIESMEGELFDQVNEHQSEGAILAALSREGISYHVASGVDNFEIFQDEVKFSQIVGNLIKNALRFRNEKLEVELARQGDRVVVEVRDDGPGIKREDHARIFRLYTQGEAGGLPARKGHGLGLAGALILAKALGGDISVQSEAGNGATFRFAAPSGLEWMERDENS